MVQAIIGEITAGGSGSYSIYLEQMFTAQLYLWHIKWEKAVKKAREDGKEAPSLRDVPRPSVLDKVSDLLDKRD